MPPKVKISKKQIIDAAVDTVRADGADALNARTLARRLASSTQPIFSNFATMDEVKETVIREAARINLEYTKSIAESCDYPPYKSSGMAYIRFAREERELFKLLYMRDRNGEVDTDFGDYKYVIDIIMSSVGLDRERAAMFHFEMWAFVHGIATMIATSYLSIDDDVASKMLTDAYMGLKLRYTGKE